MLLRFLFAVILTEALTNLVSKSGIFLFFREFLNKQRTKNIACKYLFDLVDCPYCLSVWVGWFFAVIFSLDISIGFFYPFFGYFLGGLIIHRLSNMLHFIIDRLDSKTGLSDLDIFDNNKFSIKGFDGN